MVAMTNNLIVNSYSCILDHKHWDEMRYFTFGDDFYILIPLSRIRSIEKLILINDLVQ